MISPSLATFVGLLVCLGQLADSNPYNQRQHSFSSRSNSGPNGNSYSGASYQSLGIQASASHQQPQQSRGNNEQFWWQGSQSPFSETAAKNRGVSAGARAIDTSRAHARPLVPGCGGGKCFGAAAHSVSATAVASSNSNGHHQQNALNQHYLPPQASAASFSHGSQANTNNNNHPSQQNFGAGVAASQGQAANVAPFPGCAAAMKCVTEEFCSVDGVMINTPVRLSDYEKEYLRVPLMECSNPETNQVGFCCRDPLYEDPWPADMPMPGMMNKVPSPSGPAPVNRPTVSTSNNVRPPAASSFNNFAANGNRPTVTATAAVSSSSNGRPPVSSVVAGASSFHQTSQAHQQPSLNYLPPTPGQAQRPAINLQPAAPAYQPPAPAYQSPAPAYQPTPAPTQRPVQQAVSVQQPSRPAYQPPAPPAFQGSQTQQQTNIAQGPPPPPFAGCAAALKCVTEEFCSVDGVMVNTPVRLSPYEKEYLRVPLMECTNPETNQVGFCCRDPLYEDPWPADMPMPGMMNKVPTGPATSVNRPVISASAAAVSTSNNARPPISPFNNFAANGNRPTVTATAAVSSVSNGRPQVAASSFNGQQGNPFFIPSSPAPTQRPIAHQPAAIPAYQPPSQSYLPPPAAQKPATQSHQVTPAQQPARPAFQQQTPPAYQPQYQASQSQQTNTIQGPPGPSFAGCAAALKCVTEEFCSVDGVMVNTPVRLSAFEKEYLRVPLMPCLNTENNQEGFCCRDPLYNDPWPAGMPMP